MQNYLCDNCGEHWEGREECPSCGEKFEIRKTISKEEAEKRGII